MKKQLLLFESLVPLCMNCGGSGRWENATSSGINFGLKLERLSCTRCNFQTDAMVHSCRKTMLNAWITGVPCLVSNTSREQFYKWYWKRYPMIGARYMGHSGYWSTIER